jgi:hypothetical protein
MKKQVVTMPTRHRKEAGDVGDFRKVADVA